MRIAELVKQRTLTRSKVAGYSSENLESWCPGGVHLGTAPEQCSLVRGVYAASSSVGSRTEELPNPNTPVLAAHFNLAAANVGRIGSSFAAL